MFCWVETLGAQTRRATQHLGHRGSRSIIPGFNSSRFVPASFLVKRSNRQDWQATPVRQGVAGAATDTMGTKVHVRLHILQRRGA